MSELGIMFKKNKNTHFSKSDPIAIVHKNPVEAYTACQSLNVQSLNVHPGRQDPDHDKEQSLSDTS